MIRGKMSVTENKYNGEIIIIGASAAGISAAKEIRKVNTTAKISIITDENHMPYYRPYLTEYIKDNSIEDRPNFYLNKEEWYKKNNIDIILGEKVIEIDHLKPRQFLYPCDRVYAHSRVYVLINLVNEITRNSQ